MKAWRTLGAGRKLLYLAAALLPLMGLAPFLGLASLPPKPEGVWLWLFLALPILGLLLGAANLILIFSGRPPRENRDLWDGLLAASLVPDLGLLGFGFIVFSMLRYGLPVPA